MILLVGARSKECIACAETIKSKALLCRYCGVLQDDPKFAHELESPDSSSEIRRQQKSKDNTDVFSQQANFECPTCASVVSRNWSYCNECGTDLREKSEERAELRNNEYFEPEVAPESIDKIFLKPKDNEEKTDIEDMIQCEYCEAKISTDWAFCDNCGGRIHEKADKNSDKEEAQTDSRFIDQVDGEIGSLKWDSSEALTTLFLCFFCNQEYLPGYSYCENCGSSLHAKENDSTEEGLEHKQGEVPQGENESSDEVQSDNEDAGLGSAGDDQAKIDFEDDNGFKEHSSPQNASLKTPESANSTAKNEKSRFRTVNKLLLVVPTVSVFIVIGALIVAPSVVSNTSVESSGNNESEEPEEIKTRNNNGEPEANEQPSVQGDFSSVDPQSDTTAIDASNEENTPEADSTEPPEPKEEVDASVAEADTTDEQLETPEKEISQPTEATDGLFLPQGWKSFPGATNPIESAISFTGYNNWDSHFYFDASSANRLRESVTVGKNKNGVGFCEPGEYPSLGKYSKQFADLERGKDFATCVNGKGTIFVFVTNAGWLMDMVKPGNPGGPSLNGLPGRMHWVLGRPLCSSTSFAMLVLEDEGTPAFVGEDFFDTDLWPATIALPNWKYFKIAGWTSPTYIVTSCNGGDCFEDIFGDDTPMDICQLDGG